MWLRRVIFSRFDEVLFISMFSLGVINRRYFWRVVVVCVG